MILATLLFMTMVQESASSEEDVYVEKEIRYQKETTVDLTGSDVSGENKMPPAFFVTKMQTPKADSLLQERLKFGLKDYNKAGF